MVRLEGDREGALRRRRRSFGEGGKKAAGSDCGSNSGGGAFVSAVRNFFGLPSPSAQKHSELGKSKSIKRTNYFMKRELSKHNDKNAFITLPRDLLEKEILCAGYLKAVDLCRLRSTCKSFAFSILMPHTDRGERAWETAYRTTFGAIASYGGASQRGQSYFWECAKLSVYVMHAELRNAMRSSELCASLARLPPGMVIGPVGGIGKFSDPRVAMAVAKRRPQAVFAIAIQSTHAALEFRKCTNYARPVSFIPLDACTEDGKYMCAPIKAEGFVGYAVELLELTEEDEYLRWTLIYNAYRHMTVWRTDQDARAFMRSARRSGHPAIDIPGYLYYASLDTSIPVTVRDEIGPMSDNSSISRLYSQYIPTESVVRGIRIPLTKDCDSARNSLRVGDVVAIHGSRDATQLRGRITKVSAGGLFYNVMYQETGVEGLNIPKDSLISVSTSDTAFERWCQLGSLSFTTFAFGPTFRKRVFASTIHEPLDMREATELMDAMTLSSEEGFMGNYAGMIDNAAEYRARAVLHEHDQMSKAYEKALQSFELATLRYHRGAAFFRNNT